MLLKRASQQGQIELPPELAKLKSELDFWNLFRVSCHARWGLSGRRLFSRTYLHFFCSNFVGLFDAEGQSHNTVYALHRFMIGIYCMTVSRSCKGKRVLPNPWHKRLRHINNLRKRRLGNYASLAKRLAVYTSWWKATSAPVIYTLYNIWYCVFSLIAVLPRTLRACGTEPHTHGIWSTSFRLVVT